MPSTLNETLDSLFHQTLPQFEIVAVDDGSTDGTRTAALASAMDSRLRPVRIHRGYRSGI
jgi:glycosyltransferase involved in cell wall biosynthesis